MASTRHGMNPDDRKLCKCVDGQLQRQSHEAGQRYTSPSSGECKPLIVQVAERRMYSKNDSVHEYRETWISSGHDLLIRLALRLKEPKSIWAYVGWVPTWILYIIVLFIPQKRQVFTDYYKPFVKRYIGQLFAALSPREHSILSSLTDHQGEVHAVTHTTKPRRLVYFDYNEGRSGGWRLTEDSNIIMDRPYIAISFCSRDFIHSEDGAEESNSKQEFIQKIRTLVRAEKLDAYWLDLECVDKGERERDLYQMVDVYRHAERTLVMIRREEGWSTWGERPWTLPEVLFSRTLVCKVGGGDIFPLTLDVVGARAYPQYAKEFSTIQAYDVWKDPSKRLERNMSLMAIIWRCHAPEQHGKEHDGVIPYRAEKVYALMGFFTHRIKPTNRETELQALARLSMANNNDHIIERMISMLPTNQLSSIYWFTETDYWSANLWDIEPVVQAVGVTATEAIVLDGCRAASIRWKNFPRIVYATSRSYHRIIPRLAPYFILCGIFVGVIIVMVSTHESGRITIAHTTGAVTPKLALFGLMIIFAGGIFMLVAAPCWTIQGSLGRTAFARPWLIGVRGVLSAEEVSKHLYGGNIDGFRRTLYTPSGTPFSTPKVPSEFREGLKDQVEKARLAGEHDPQRGHLFTLVDTLSGTVYYFQAKRPPTVCLFTGKEGGLGRFVLCSEICATNELRKEAVLRMPSYIGEHMRACDWVAIGGVGSTNQTPMPFENNTPQTQHPEDRQTH